MYMSYCRHEGTFAELRACLRDAEDHVNGEAGAAVSDGEIRHFRNMIEYFAGWLQDMALLDEEGYLDDAALDEVCEAMGRDGGDEEVC